MSAGQGADNPVAAMAALGAEVMAAAGASALGLIAAELRALHHVLPAADWPDTAGAKAAAQVAEAEIEADFDNLPV